MTFGASSKNELAYGDFEVIFVTKREKLKFMIQTPRKEFIVYKVIKE